MKPETKKTLERVMLDRFHLTPHEPWTENEIFKLIDATYDAGLTDAYKEMLSLLDFDAKDRYINKLKIVI